MTHSTTHTHDDQSADNNRKYDRVELRWTTAHLTPLPRTDDKQIPQATGIELPNCYPVKGLIRTNPIMGLIRTNKKTTGLILIETYWQSQCRRTIFKKQKNLKSQSPVSNGINL